VYHPAVRYAVHFHAFGLYADPRRLAALAREAEDAGWDGVFVNDHLAARGGAGWEPVANPWIALAAIAAATERVRLGPMVAALPRRRPWQLASETATLDRLSGGRLVLGVGSGTGIGESFAPYGEALDLRARAAMLDEGLEILTGLWRGEPFTFRGRHYRAEGAVSLPGPVQEPRVPVWVAGSWPHRRPFRRAARWDGVFVDVEGVDWLRGEVVPPDVLGECVRYILAHRGDGTGREAPFDVVIGGRSPDDPGAAAARLAPYAGAGLTWWVEGIHPAFGPPEALAAKIRRGPPRG
jgi:Luciferase-like monooxygenase